jgi:hypothetical protein
MTRPRDDEDRIDLVDLVVLCDEQCAADLGWFVALGERVRDEPDPHRQRWYATAAHRHAWHADLWAQRRPTVPHDAAHALPAPARVEVGDDLAAAYHEHLATQRERRARLRDAVDPDLDPSTRRVIALVDADLADLQAGEPPA